MSAHAKSNSITVITTVACMLSITWKNVSTDFVLIGLLSSWLWRKRTDFKLLLRASFTSGREHTNALASRTDLVSNIPKVSNSRLFSSIFFCLSLSYSVKYNSAMVSCVCDDAGGQTQGEHFSESVFLVWHGWLVIDKGWHLCAG